MKFRYPKKLVKKKYELYKLIHSKKYQYIRKWNFFRQLQMKSSRAPLTNIENVISRRNAMKSNSTPRKIVETNFSSTKENIEIYNITDHSMKGIDKGLHSIKF